MKTRAAILLHALVLPLALAAQSSVPSGRDMTDKTQADPRALEALETPGKVFFEEGFESGEWTKRHGVFMRRLEGAWEEAQKEALDKTRP